MKRDARLTKRQRRITVSGTREREQLSTIAGMESSAAGYRRLAAAFKTASAEGKREARKVFLASARELKAAADALVKALESE
jgi:hypothetical protein